MSDENSERYSKLISECTANKGFTKYHKQGLTLMILLLILVVLLVERTETISKNKQHVVDQDFEACITAICLGGDDSNVTECLSMVTPTLANITLLNEQFARGPGVKRIMVKPLSECQ